MEHLLQRRQQFWTRLVVEPRGLSRAEPSVQAPDLCTVWTRRTRLCDWSPRFDVCVCVCLCVCMWVRACVRHFPLEEPAEGNTCLPLIEPPIRITCSGTRLDGRNRGTALSSSLRAEGGAVQGRVQGRTRRVQGRVQGRTWRVQGRVQGRTRRVLGWVQGRTTRVQGQVQGRTWRVQGRVQVRTRRVQGRVQEGPGAGP